MLNSRQSDGDLLNPPHRLKIELLRWENHRRITEWTPAILRARWWHKRSDHQWSATAYNLNLLGLLNKVSHHHGCCFDTSPLSLNSCRAPPVRHHIHRRTRQHIRGPNQHRNPIGQWTDECPLCSSFLPFGWSTANVSNIIGKLVAVFSPVYRDRRRAKNRYVLFISLIARLLGICPPVDTTTPNGCSRSRISITRSKDNSSK